MEHNDWLTLCAADELLGDVLRSADQQRDYSLRIQVMKSRACLWFHLRQGRDRFSETHTGQLSLIETPIGRLHDTDPAD